jgi:hypothetical protein
VRQGDAAQVGRRGKASRVADHAAAHGDDGAAAIGALADQRFVDARDRLQVLVALAVRDQDRLAAAERALNLRAMQAPDHRARHDEPPRADLVRVEQRRDPIGDAFADPDRGRAGARVDVDANRFLGSGGCHVSDGDCRSERTGATVSHGGTEKRRSLLKTCLRFSVAPRESASSANSAVSIDRIAP